MVRIELRPENSDQVIQAEITRERYRELDLHEGDRVYIRPKQARIFTGDRH